MIYNKHLYVKRIREVAVKLDYLLKDVVFVGGSVVALYADDPAADEVRPTDDVDIIVGISSRSEYSAFESDIRKLGFQNVIDSPVLCRYKINGIIVDVMPTDEAVLGFTNTWYKKGMEESFSYKIDDEISIRLMLFPYFIASKIEAHNSRNKSGLRTSKDFEDIVYSFDNRKNPLEDLQQASMKVRDHLKQEIDNFLQDPNFDEGVYSHLNSGTASSRSRRIKGIWSAFVLEK